MMKFFFPVAEVKPEKRQCIGVGEVGVVVAYPGVAKTRLGWNFCKRKRR